MGASTSKENELLNSLNKVPHIYHDRISSIVRRTPSDASGLEKAFVILTPLVHFLFTKAN